MPYSKWSEVNNALKGIKPKISLAQANVIADWADAMERAEDGPQSPWAAAIAQFKKLYKVQGGKWVKRKAKEGDMAYRGYFTSGSATVEVRAIDVDGEAVPVAELVAAYEEQQDRGQEGAEDDDADLQEAVWTTAFVNDLPDSSFAVIMPGGEKDGEGKTKPRSLRKLPYKDAGGKVDVPHLRNALARLPQMKGVSAELKSRALKTLQAAAKKHLKTHQEETAKVDVGKVRSLLQEALAMLDNSTEMEETQLSESATGHAITLEEAGASANPRDPLLMNVSLIEPGFGNKKDNHYYPVETLKRDAHVFEGVKMYATDHRPDEKSVRTEVAVIKACPVAFTNKGAPIAQVAVHDPGFAEQARNRAKLGTLSSLECSILALGKTKKGKVGDRETNIVEAITKGQSVDWVTKAGAGGHALALAENDGGEIMSEQEKEKDQKVEETSPEEARTEEVVLAEQGQAQEEEAPQKLAEAEVEKLVEGTKLPATFKAALKVVQYEDEDAARAAIAEAVEEVKKLTGSGQVFGQGGSEPAQDKPLSEREKIIRFNKHLEAVGGRPVPVPAEQ